MLVEMFTLPLRVSIRSAQLMLRGVEEIAGRTIAVASRVTGTASGGEPTPERPPERQRPSARQRPAEPTPREPTPREPTPREPARERPAATERAPEPPEPRQQEPARPAPARPAPARPAPEPTPPPEPEPSHVSEEATLVREEAEPGAEDGAGAQVHVAEPWNGYNEMHADEVIARLADATSAELTAVRLYEGTRRSRQTVLEAVDRELRRVANQP